jgi:hypothetical protein
MLALGHKPTFAAQKGMSALSPKADIPTYRRINAIRINLVDDRALPTHGSDFRT